MQVAAHCPQCSARVVGAVEAPADRLQCPACSWSRTVGETDLVEGQPVRCLACGCDDLWRQKDFPPQLGLSLVALAALLSTVAWAMHWPVAWLGILLAFALLDLVLYTCMRDVLVCYRCKARHRRSPISESHPRFNLELAERYRQEALRVDGARSPNS